MTEFKIDDISIRQEALWGAPAIAHFLSRSVDFVYDKAKLPGCPIYQPDGENYFALKSELTRWLRTKPASASICQT